MTLKKISLDEFLRLGQQFYHTGSGHIEEIWQTGF